MSGCALGAEAHPLSGGQIEGMAVQIVGDLFVADILGVKLVDQLDGVLVDWMAYRNATIANVSLAKVGAVAFTVGVGALRAVALAVS